LKKYVFVLLNISTFISWHGTRGE